MNWISIKDKLPTCWSQHRDNYGSGYLLGYTKYGEIVITQFWNDKDWEIEGEEVDFITHWMNLPLPPQT